MKKVLVRVNGSDLQVQITDAILNLYNLRQNIFDKGLEEMKSIIQEAYDEFELDIELPKLNNHLEAIAELDTIICGFICEKLEMIEGKDLGKFFIELYESTEDQFKFVVLIMDFNDFEEIIPEEDGRVAQT